MPSTPSTPSSVQPTPSSTSADAPTTPHASTLADTPQRDRERFFGLSAAQVAASALAAGTSAFAASTLGVAGTLIGALVGSLIATIASAVYSHSLRRAGQRLRVMRPVPVRGDASSEPRVVEGPVRREQPRTWPRVVVGVAAGALLAVGAITGIESLLGHPISDSSGSGTSVGTVIGDSGRPARQPKPAKAPAPSATTPASVPTSTATAPTPASSQPTTTQAPTGTPTDPPTTPAPEVSTPNPAASSGTPAPTPPNAP